MSRHSAGTTGAPSSRLWGPAGGDPRRRTGVPGVDLAALDLPCPATRRPPPSSSWRLRHPVPTWSSKMSSQPDAHRLRRRPAPHGRHRRGRRQGGTGGEPVADIRPGLRPGGHHIAGPRSERASTRSRPWPSPRPSPRGRPRLADAAELRVKESDRIGTIAQELSQLGIDGRPGPNLSRPPPPPGWERDRRVLTSIPSGRVRASGAERSDSVTRRPRRGHLVRPAAKPGDCQGRSCSMTPISRRRWGHQREAWPGGPHRRAPRSP